MAGNVRTCHIAVDPALITEHGCRRTPFRSSAIHSHHHMIANSRGCFQPILVADGTGMCQDVSSEAVQIWLTAVPCRCSSSLTNVLSGPRALGLWWGLGRRIRRTNDACSSRVLRRGLDNDHIYCTDAKTVSSLGVSLIRVQDASRTGRRTDHAHASQPGCLDGRHCRLPCSASMNRVHI